MINECQKLNEKVLILRWLLPCILVTTFIGLASFFFPWLYSMVPVYETQKCFDYYKNSDHIFPQLHDNSLVIKINIIAFISFNWLELLIMIIMIFKIRNAKDELSI